MAPKVENDAELRNMIVVTVAMTVVLAQLLRMATGGGLFSDSLYLDGDIYSWLNRVEALAAGQGWYDQTVMAVNPPEGHEQHWTRLLDGMLWLGGMALSPLFGFRDGLALWANIISPLLMIPAVWLMYRLARLLLDKREALVAAGVFAVHPMILLSYAWGRADHHALLRLGLVAFFYCFVHVVLYQNDRLRWAAAAGLVATLTMWATVEALGFVLIALVFMGLWWLKGERDLSAAAAVMSGVMFVGSVVVVAIEHGPRLVEALPIDTIGLPYLIVFGLNALFWLGLWGWDRWGMAGAGIAVRAAVSGALALLVLGAIGLWAPQFYDGPFANVDELYRQVRLEHIGEQLPALQPEFYSPMEMVGRAIALFGIAMVGLVGLVKQFKNTDGARRWVWVLMGAMAVAFALLALDTVRWSAYMPVGASLCFAVAVAPLLDWLERRQAQGKSVVLVRPAVLVAIFLGLVGTGLVIEFAGERWRVMVESEEDNGEGQPAQPMSERLAGTLDEVTCDLRQVVPLMEQMEEIEDGALIAIDPDRGSEMVYRSGYGVLAIANHRYQPGFTLFVTAMREHDLERAHRLLSERGVDALMICTTQLWPTLMDEGKTTLEQLARGDDPNPFERLKTPEEAGGFWIYDVSSSAGVGSALDVDED